MSQQELANRNANPFVQRVLSWGRNPDIAKLRGQVPVRRADAYTLRCRRGQGSQFDVAASVTEDGAKVHLKNSVEKIDTYYDVAKLITIGIFGQADWISVDTENGTLSVSRKRLEATLRALGLTPAT